MTMLDLVEAGPGHPLQDRTTKRLGTSPGHEAFSGARSPTSLLEIDLAFFTAVRRLVLALCMICRADARLSFSKLMFSFLFLQGHGTFHGD